MVFLKRIPGDLRTLRNLEFLFTLFDGESSGVFPATVRMDYVNWKGVRRIRTVEALNVKFVPTEYHGGDPEWIFRAFDVEKGAIRSFSVRDILSIEVVKREDAHGQKA